MGILMKNLGDRSVRDESYMVFHPSMLLQDPPSTAGDDLSRSKAVTGSPLPVNTVSCRSDQTIDVQSPCPIPSDRLWCSSQFANSLESRLA